MQIVRTVREMQNALRIITENKANGSLTYAFLESTGWEWLTPFLSITDTLLEQSHGKLQLLKSYWITNKIDVEDNTRLLMFKYAIQAVYKAHEYELQKLIATLDLEYNPIWNLDSRTETVHVGEDTGKLEESGNTDNTGSIVAQNTTTTDHTGTDKLKDSYGERNQSSGKNTNTNYGEVKVTINNTHTVSPEDTGVMYNESGDNGTNTTANRQDGVTETGNATEEARTDNHDRTVALKDSTESGGTQDTENKEKFAREQSDVRTTSYSDIVIRSGNQGVTTTQQMIKEEREVAMFSIYNRIKDIFISELCMGVYTDGVERRDRAYGDYIL